jgi:hypothetical protein
MGFGIPDSEVLIDLMGDRPKASMGEFDGNWPFRHGRVEQTSGDSVFNVGFAILPQDLKICESNKIDSTEDIMYSRRN